MKRLICLMFLLVSGGSQAFNSDDYDEYSDNSHRYDSIERPCSIHDLNCIRRFFAYSTGCKPARGYAPDPYITETVPLDVPHSNASAVLHDIQLKGLNSGNIEEFYINKKTDTLVLEVEFDKLVVYSPKTEVKYHRKGKEPITTSDYSEATFKRLSLTLTIQHYADSKRAQRYVYAYFTYKPLLKFGSGLQHTEETNMQWVNDFGLSAKEGIISLGAVYMDAFLETKICSFGYH